MEQLIDIYNLLIDRYSIAGLVLLAAIITLLALQLGYLMRRYGRIPVHHNPAPASQDPVSVVVVVQNNNAYLTDILPTILEQEYPMFEVVAVVVDPDEDIENTLQMLGIRYPRFSPVPVKQDDRFPMGIKLALNVGIKTARYENILLTTTDAYPASKNWLAVMAKGFSKGDIVIGYCALEPGKGLASKIMRSSRIMLSANYLSAAIKGRPYRAMRHNMGIKRSLYLNARGFNHLNTELGYDDLFIQSIATAKNTAVVISPHGAMRQRRWGGLGWWGREAVNTAKTKKYYPGKAKRYINGEIVSRVLLLACLIASAVMLPMEIGIAAGVIFLLRLFLVRFEFWRVGRRLGERKFLGAFLLYDLFSPVCCLVVATMGRMKSRRL